MDLTHGDSATRVPSAPAALGVAGAQRATGACGVMTTRPPIVLRPEACSPWPEARFHDAPATACPCATLAA